MRKLRVIALAASLAAAAATLTPVAASAAPAAATAVKLGKSSVNWGTCASTGLQRRGAQCAMLSVPLDYSKPNGAKIKLAISRIKHKAPDAQFQGVMLTNPGGPGGSGLTLSVLGEFVPPAAGDTRSAGDYYDWIGFDPRGVGSSEPAISCDPNYFDYPRPNYIPVQPSDLQKWLTRSQGYAADCAANNGDILKHVTTVDSAKDMDSIRKALGARQINYYGFSYGTYLGQVYSTLYPNRVRREVLDSNVDPRKIWYDANLDQDVAFDRNINIWFAWLAKFDSVYHLGKTQSAVKTLFYKNEAKLTFHPQAAQHGTIGGDEWVDAFLYAGYYQVTWLELAQTFADYVHNGAIDEVEAAYVNAQGPGDDNGFAVYNAVQCTDVQFPQSLTKVLADNWRVFAQAPFETWSNAWFNEPCQFWPAPAQTPVTIDGSKVKSALLIDETLDAATPYEGSLQVRRLFPNASLIALPGGTSHANSLNGDECLDNQIADYLALGRLPARQPGDGADTTCQPLPVPDPTAAAASVLTTASPTGASAVTGRALTAIRP